MKEHRHANGHGERGAKWRLGIAGNGLTTADVHALQGGPVTAAAG
jgi:hypothetical protein